MPQNEEKKSMKVLISWALYDWANSAFFAVIQTFIFATYFTQAVASSKTIGTAEWGNTLSLAGLVIAVAGPLLGAWADQLGRRKPWIIFFSIIAISTTAGLWFIQPDNHFVMPALGLVFAATVASECAIIFYNAMLPGLAPPKRVGRWSGWAWGLGYAGGLACLIMALFVFINPAQAPFGLSKTLAEPVRATFLLVAGWYLLFSLPLFFYTPDTPRTGIALGKAMKKGWQQLRYSFSHLKQYRSIAWFIAARMIFIDALTTVFAFGGIYAAGTFGMDSKHVIYFGIGLNLTAGIGAALFAWIDDYLGSRTTILLSLGGLIVTVSAVLLVHSLTLFWISGLLLGVFVGPVQAASRTYMARAAPPKLRNEMFGLLALSGKATAFIGPLLVGQLTYWSGSQRIGMTVIALFFLIGFLMMLYIPEANRPDKVYSSS